MHSNPDITPDAEIIYNQTELNRHAQELQNVQLQLLQQEHLATKQKLEARLERQEAVTNAQTAVLNSLSYDLKGLFVHNQACAIHAD